MNVYSFALFWNGKSVARGVATCAVTSDIVRGHLGEQFAGMDHKAWCAAKLSGLLDRLLHGIERETLEYSDDTGHAVAIIERMF